MTDFVLATTTDGCRSRRRTAGL